MESYCPFFNKGLSTTEMVALAVAMHEKCYLLYGMQSHGFFSKHKPIPLIH